MNAIKKLRIVGLCLWLSGLLGLASLVAAIVWELADEAGMRVWGACSGLWSVLCASAGCLMCLDENARPADFGE